MFARQIIYLDSAYLDSFSILKYSCCISMLEIQLLSVTSLECRNGFSRLLHPFPYRLTQQNLSECLKCYSSTEENIPNIFSCYLKDAVTLLQSKNSQLLA
uniref:Uncharacterized protein n=1 Tax=Octopus bimaculoides TaxID=37653 RepID=A0A0L8G4K5_OCTBM